MISFTGQMQQSSGKESPEGNYSSSLQLSGTETLILEYPSPNQSEHLPCIQNYAIFFFQYCLLRTSLCHHSALHLLTSRQEGCSFMVYQLAIPAIMLHDKPLRNLLVQKQLPLAISHKSVNELGLDFLLLDSHMHLQ